MGSDNSNIDVDVSALNTETSLSPALGSSPVNQFSHRQELQKSISNFSLAISSEPSEQIKSNIGLSLKSIPAPVTSPENPSDKPHLSVTQDEEEEELQGSLKSGTSKNTSGLTKFWKAICRISKNVANADLGNIAVSAARITGNICKGTVKAVFYAANNPVQCLSLIKAAGVGLISAATGLVSGAANEIENLFTDPLGTIKRFVGFLKSLSDTIGLTDIVAGCYHGIMTVGCLAVFNFSGAAEHAKQSTRAVKGAFVAIGEFTGITDLGRAVIELSKGNYGKAAFFGAIGAGQIYLICSTLGLGNVLSKSGVEAAKEGVRILAKQTGQEVVEAVEKKLSGEMLEKTGSRFAVDAAKSVLRQWETIAADLFSGCKKIVSNTVEHGLEKLLREQGTKEIVTESTEKLLYKIYETTVKDLAKEFTVHGIGLKEAEYMAKCLKKALLKPGKKSRYHVMLAEEIIDEISGQLKENLMERGLKKGFEKTWLKSVERISKFKGLSPDQADFLLKGGIEGFEEGAELAVRKIVREGVEEAFKRFRMRTFLLDYGVKTTELEYKVDKLTVDYTDKNAGRDKLNKNRRKYKNVKLDKISRDKDTGLEIKSAENEDEYSRNKYIEL